MKWIVALGLAIMGAAADASTYQVTISGTQAGVASGNTIGNTIDLVVAYNPAALGSGMATLGAASGLSLSADGSPVGTLAPNFSIIVPGSAAETTQIYVGHDVTAPSTPADHAMWYFDLFSVDLGQAIDLTSVGEHDVTGTIWIQRDWQEYSAALKIWASDYAVDQHFDATHVSITELVPAAVPLPATGAALPVALGALALMRRRRAAKAA